ncbi:MAG: LysR family transcriptional regulator, partial [Hyphomicrobiaceae bacterium]
MYGSLQKSLIYARRKRRLQFPMRFMNRPPRLQIPNDGPSTVPMQPSLHELEALRATIAWRTTTLAARDLGISQPSVSRAIASLEKRVGRRLFEREKGRLVPTAEALALEARAAVVFDLMGQLTAPFSRSESEGSIRIASPPTLAQDFLAPMLARYLASEPHLSIHVEIGKSGDCLATVAEGSADLGLVGVTGVTPTHFGVRFEVFRTAQPHVVLPKGHKLASRSLLGPRDLADQRLVVLTRRFPLRTRVEATFAAAGIVPKVVV